MNISNSSNSIVFLGFILMLNASISYSQSQRFKFSPQYDLLNVDFTGDTLYLQKSVKLTTQYRNKVTTPVRGKLTTLDRSKVTM